MTASVDAPGIKLAAQMSCEASEEELRFVRQMGIDYAVLWTDASKAGYEFYAECRKRFANAGLTVYAFGNVDVHNQDVIVLNLPGRDAKVAEYKRHLTDLGRAGIPYTTYAHMANGIWSSARETTRGEAEARAFDLHAGPTGWWQRQFVGPLTHGRRYTEEEIWANFASFIAEVAPVAEQSGVKIGIHPDDPPVPDLGGIPRCIFSSFEGYRAALELADSPNVGVCLCVGTWLEGGPLMGRSATEAARAFGRAGKLFKIHLRNVSSPLPHFVETFVDDGYQDMCEVVAALHEVDFDGIVIPDHIPTMVGDSRLGTAFSLGYIKALIHQVSHPADRTIVD